MKPLPTIFDSLYRSSFRNEVTPGWPNNAELRRLLISARRFTLSDEMSAFLGDLSTAAFVKSPQLRGRIMENLRVGARLPHDTTWIEFNLRVQQARSKLLLGRDPVPTDEVPLREGWLLQRHPNIETAFIAHIFTQNPPEEADKLGFETWLFPVAFTWVVDNETVIPWRSVPVNSKGARLSEVATGITDYITDRVSICRESSPLLTPAKIDMRKVVTLLQEWVGVTRRMFALLATINDLPVEVREVRVAKGFVARGRYRRYLDHKTITLTIPESRYTKVARTALADAHRRAHLVRGHWRDDWRHPYSKLCEHAYAADEHHRWCTHCRGRELWVRPHQRGDASQALVISDYAVETAAVK